MCGIFSTGSGRRMLKRDKLKLDEIIDRHKNWLKGECSEGQANLRNYIGRGVAWQGIVLSAANLRGAYLYEANLRDSKLQEACLYDANLGKTDLREADLRAADLGCATLDGADLRAADLRGAYLYHSSMIGVRLEDVDIRYITSGNGKEIVTLQSRKYPIVYTAQVMAIKNKQAALSEWWNFSDDQIAEIDNEALEWWKIHKSLLQTWIAANPATPTGQALQGV